MATSASQASTSATEETGTATAASATPPETTEALPTPSPALQRNSLNGSWILDKTRGEWSMTKYLQVMNVDRLAVEAHEKAEREQDTIHTIELAPPKVRIVKRSRVNADLVVNLELGKELTETLPPGDRPKKSLAKSDHPGHLTIESSLCTVNGEARVTDTKQLDNTLAATKGTVMVQELTITNEMTRKQHTTTRYFLPLLKTPPEHMVGGGSSTTPTIDMDTATSS